MQTMIQKLLGASWEGKVAATIVVLAGTPLVASMAGLALPAWLLFTCGMSGLVATAFGFGKAKSEKSTTSVSGENVRVG